MSGGRALQKRPSPNCHPPLSFIAGARHRRQTARGLSPFHCRRRTHALLGSLLLARRCLSAASAGGLKRRSRQAKRAASCRHNFYDRDDAVPVLCHPFAVAIPGPVSCSWAGSLLVHAPSLPPSATIRFCEQCVGASIAMLDSNTDVTALSTSTTMYCAYPYGSLWNCNTYGTSSAC